MARRASWSSEEIDAGLTVFALEGGRKRATEANLRAAGLKIPFRTVKTWAHGPHAERYQRIQAEVETRVRGRLRDQFHRLAAISGSLSEDILGRIATELTSRDRELAEVDAALERLGEIADDDREALAIRRDLWRHRDRLRLDLRQLGELLSKSGVMGGIATDKIQVLSGRPTVLVEHSFPEIAAALERKGVRLRVGQGASPAIPVAALPSGDEE